METDILNWVGDETERYGDIKALLAAKQAGEVSVDEFSFLLDELTLDHLDNYVYVPEPAEPVILRGFRDDMRSSEWMEKTLAEKQRIRASVYERQEVQEYCKKRQEIASLNWSNACRLENMILSWIDLGEVERANKVHAVYHGYPQKIMLNSRDVLWEKRRKWSEL